MKKRTLILTVLGLYLAVETTAQQLPLGTCGIVNVYDAAGNRTKRVYFCNNGIDPYPSKAAPAQIPVTEDKKNETNEFEYVDALYPNPTTGKFFVTFSKNLSDAIVSILDNNGRSLARFHASGSQVNFDLSPYAAGVYFVRIEEDGKVISKKVVKQ